MSRKQASGGGAGPDASGVERSGWGSPDDYEIRRYRPRDLEGVLDLDRTVWDRDRDPEWFRWKYERNPHVEEPPIFVAEGDGEIVGSRSLMAFPLRAGWSESTRLALQPEDTTVHPDHRRRGIFTRMTERAIEIYHDRPPALFLNFPNEQSRPGYEKLGWRAVRLQVTHHRVEHPGAFVDGTLLADLLASHGFLPDDRLPLSRLTCREKTQVALSLDVDGADAAWSVDGLRLDRPGNWFASFLERDTS